MTEDNLQNSSEQIDEETAKLRKWLRELNEQESNNASVKEEPLELAFAKCRICNKYSRNTHVVSFTPTFGHTSEHNICDRCYNKLITKDRWIWMNRLW